MNNNEHLALFVLGIGTLGVTFLLLFALSERNPASIPVLESQVQVTSAQAAVVPQAAVAPQAAPEAAPSAGMAALDREVADTFSKAAAYLGRGKFVEEEHIALLERLEVYGGLSSIRPEQRKAAQDFVKDMERLLTLKESVAKQVRLAGQISAVETDAQMHLASGRKSLVEARKIMDRIENLYAVRGLSDEQNRRLSTALASLKKAYKPAPKPVVHARKTEKPKPVAKARPAPAPAPAPEPVVQAASAPAPVVQAAPEPKPAPVVQAKPAPVKKEDPLKQEITKRYSRVMTMVSRYFVVRKYNKDQHAELTTDLMEIKKFANLLGEDDRQRLLDTIEKMNAIEERMKTKVSKR